MAKVVRTYPEKPVVTVDPNVVDDAQGAIANLIKVMEGDRRAHIYWYNIVGTNKGSLMHRMGIQALEYCALMLVAGLIEFQKVRNDERYRLTAKRKPWEDFISRHMLQDFVEWTTYRIDYEEMVDGKLMKKKTPEIGFVRLGHVGLNPAKHRQHKNNLRDMQPGDQIGNDDISPPRLNISSALDGFYKEISSFVGQGYSALSYNVTADKLEQGKYLMTENEREALDAAAAAIAELSDDDASDDESYGSDDMSDGDDISLSDVADEEEAQQPTKVPRRPYPALSAGVEPMEDPTDPKNKDALMTLFGECHSSLAAINGRKKSRTTEATLTNGQKGSFVHVLQAKRGGDEDEIERRFLKSSKEAGLIPSLLSAIGGEGNEAAAARSLTVAIGREHKEAVREATKTLGLHAGIIDPMTPEETASLKVDANLSNGQMRVVKRKVEGHISKNARGKTVALFSKERDTMELEATASEPIFLEPYRKYQNDNKKKTEVVRSWYKKVDKTVEQYLKDLFSDEDRESGKRSSDLERVAVVIAGDHGQGAFLADLSVWLYFKYNIVESHEIEVGNIECKKDDFDTLHKTILIPLGESLRGLCDVRVKAIGSRGVKVVKKDSHEGHGGKNLQVFVTGDLQFYATILGRVAANYWCFKCNLYPKDWKADPFATGGLWTMERFKMYAGYYKNKTFGNEDGKYLGQRKDPAWDMIPLLFWACPLLHLKIGFGNDIFSHLIDWIERDIVQISAEEIAVRNSLSVAEESLQIKEAEKNIIKANVDDISAELDADDYDREEKQLMRQERTELNQSLKDIKKDIKQLETAVSNYKTTLQKYRTARNYEDDGIEGQIHGALAALSIKREDYFASAFNGVNIQRIMDNSSAIFDSIKTILKNKKRGDSIDDETIDQKCIEYKKLLDLVDAALAYLHIRFPGEDNMAETKDAIDKAVKLADELGLSITPKWHLLGAHVYPQHKYLVDNGWGGLFFLDESFIEKAHQRNLKLQRLLRGMRVYKQRHLTANKRGHLAKLPNVQKHSDKNREIKKRASAKADAAVEAKRLKREDALNN
jgi:hypothetical protein